MKRVLVLFLMVAIAVSSFAAGARETQTFTQTEWQIPFLNVLTGPIASIGEYLLWGAERAAQEINAAGGINGVPIRVVPIDTGMDPNKGVVEMSRLVEGNFIAAIGPVPEPVIMAAMPIAVENGFFSMTATTSYEYAAPFFPWTVSWFPPTVQRLPYPIRAWARMFPDMRRIVQFVEHYGPWPGMAAAHVVGLQAEGRTVLTDVEVPTDAVSFGPLIVRALEQNPDGIIFAANAEKVARMIIELRNRGWDKMDRILIFNSADDAPLYATGGANLNGAMIYNFINAGFTGPRWLAFRDAYGAARGGAAPPSLSTHYYDAIYMLAQAIRETRVTGNPANKAAERRAVAEYLANVKGFQGLMFTWDMRDGVPTNKPLYLMRINDGRKQLVAEVRADQF